MYARIFAVIVLIFSGRVYAQPTQEQLLVFVEKALLSCREVESVERSESFYRVYTKSLFTSYSEFDLRELKVNLPVMNEMILLQCQGLPCISRATAIQGRWTQGKVSNQFLLMCPGIADRLRGVINSVN